MERTPEMTKHRLPRHQRRLLPISMLLIGTSVVAAASPDPTLTGKVVGIADGDTLTLLVDKTQIKVRLEGIDTPEQAQPFGRKAGQALAKRVFGKTVQVDDLGKDRYGRTLGIVRLGKRNVNLDLVQEGSRVRNTPIAKKQANGAATLFTATLRNSTSLARNADQTGLTSIHKRFMGPKHRSCFEPPAKNTGSPRKTLAILAARL
jgi:endonuclease YncB( thermonuclease family)